MKNTAIAFQFAILIALSQGAVLLAQDTTVVEQRPAQELAGRTPQEQRLLAALEREIPLQSSSKPWREDQKPLIERREDGYRITDNRGNPFLPLLVIADFGDDEKISKIQKNHLKLSRVVSGARVDIEESGHCHVHVKFSELFEQAQLRINSSDGKSVAICDLQPGKGSTEEYQSYYFQIERDYLDNCRVMFYSKNDELHQFFVPSDFVKVKEEKKKLSDSDK